MRFWMRTLSSKERVLPHTPSPKEQRAEAECEQLLAMRLFFRPSLIAARTNPTSKNNNALTLVGAIFFNISFHAYLKSIPSIAATHPLCRRLSSLICAHRARAIFVAASVGLIATIQAAQSNKSAWELLAEMISRSTPQAILSADWSRIDATGTPFSGIVKGLFAGQQRDP